MSRKTYMKIDIYARPVDIDGERLPGKTFYQISMVDIESIDEENLTAMYGLRGRSLYKHLEKEGVVKVVKKKKAKKKAKPRLNIDRMKTAKGKPAKKY